jgi:hypothetical protein
MMVDPRTESPGSKVRAIAFYLPQFHPIPENDEWWGNGFTEWTNVVKARPLFPGHYQPHVPKDLGFYDLRMPDTRAAQAQMARDHGVEGFCYWHYWFAGKRLLERPFNEVLRSGEPDFPFCLGWANQTWTGIWHGAPGRVLVEQTYPGQQDYEDHFRAILPALQDSRYITVDGRPVIVIYCPYDIPQPEQFTDCWRTLAEKAGFKGLYFVGLTTKNWHPEKHGFDASASRTAYDTALSPHPFWTLIDKALNRTVRRTRDAIGLWPRIYRYKDIVRHAFVMEPDAPTRHPVVIPNWDNTPRCGRRGYVFHKSTPELFRAYLRRAVERVESRDPEHRIVFLKSWNEWAEGNYLEPDLQYGRAYLEVLRDEIVAAW